MLRICLDMLGKSGTGLRVLSVFAMVFGLQLVPARSVSAEPGLLESQMIESVNLVRAEAGLPPLVQEPALEALATERSIDMASRGYFSHVTPEGLSIFNLMDQRGVAFNVAGENLAWNYEPEHQATSVAMQSFVNSPPHRANLLGAQYTQIGVGIAYAGGRTYFTLVFVG